MAQRRRYNVMVDYEEKSTNLKNKSRLIEKWTDIEIMTRHSTQIT